MSATTWTMMTSLVAAAIPLQALAARRLVCDVASAPQMQVRTTKTPLMMLIGLRPKMFESGTTMMVKKPRVRMLTPVRRPTCV